jgi:hypothetical protein
LCNKEEKKTPLEAIFQFTRSDQTCKLAAHLMLKAFLYACLQTDISTTKWQTVKGKRIGNSLLDKFLDENSIEDNRLPGLRVSFSSTSGT